MDVPSLSKPHLPELSGQVLLDVFTHPSLGGDNNSRYTCLGAQFVPAAVTLALFQHARNPSLDSRQIAEKCEVILNNAFYDRALNVYSLKTKLRCLPDHKEVIMQDTRESQAFFNAYAGGIVIQHGADRLNRWVTELLVYDSKTPPTDGVKREPVDFDISSSDDNFSSYNFSAQSSSSIPLQSQPASPQVPNKTFSSLLNELCQQKRTGAEYEWTSSGPPHQPMWSVKVKVGGSVHGQASASEKKIAKENAAKLAISSLGWS